MASEGPVAGERHGGWTAAFWFTGVALFVVELNAGLDYVQARLAAVAPNFFGCLPAWGLAAWRLTEGAFWNCGQWEVAFRFIPFVTLPFLLVGLALSMKRQGGLRHQANATK